MGVPIVMKNKELSLREMQIVNLICKPFSMEQIADELHVSIHTVKTHKKNILRKLELSTTVELIVWAFRNNLVS